MKMGKIARQKTDHTDAGMGKGQPSPDVPGYRRGGGSIPPPRDPSGRQRRIYQLPGQEV